MRLLFAGTPEAALPSLDALLASDHEVLAVLTRPDAPTGRGRALRLSPVAERALAAGLEVLRPTSLRDVDLLDRLHALAPDCCAVVAYGALVPPVALAVPEHGWVNLHFSLLPAWRGAAPVQHAVWHGDDVTGATTFRLEEGLDTGPVYGTVAEAVRTRDSSGELLGRLAESGAALLVATMDGIASGTLAPVPQPADGVSYAPKLTAQDARVDWTQPAVRVDRQVRACTPEPGAWSMLGEGRVGLGPVTPAPEEPALESGAVRITKRDVWVGTATVPVRLGEVRAPGKRAMSAADWARGGRLPDGAALR